MSESGWISVESASLVLNRSEESLLARVVEAEEGNPSIARRDNGHTYVSRTFLDSLRGDGFTFTYIEGPVGAARLIRLSNRVCALEYELNILREQAAANDNLRQKAESSGIAAARYEGEISTLQREITATRSEFDSVVFKNSGYCVELGRARERAEAAERKVKKAGAFWRRAASLFAVLTLAAALYSLSVRADFNDAAAAECLEHSGRVEAIEAGHRRGVAAAEDRHREELNRVMANYQKVEAAYDARETAIKSRLKAFESREAGLVKVNLGLENRVIELETKINHLKAERLLSGDWWRLLPKTMPLRFIGR